MAHIPYIFRLSEGCVQIFFFVVSLYLLRKDHRGCSTQTGLKEIVHMCTLGIRSQCTLPTHTHQKCEIQPGVGSTWETEAAESL